MSGLRQIETESYAKVVPPSSFGPPQKLEWLSISALRIDPAYQREITLVGRKNIRKIASEFDWSMFSPVMVASVGSGLYAIVDGQHRATAAALAGIERVPCSIVDINRAAQARAFRSINSNTTRLHTVQLFHAALAAGDPDAARIADICRAAGVTIVRYPTRAHSLKVGETMLSKVLLKAAAAFTDRIVIAALKALVSTGGGNAGLLGKEIVYGTAEVLHDRKEWLADEKRLHAAFDSLVIEDLLTEARVIAARTKGTSVLDQYEARLLGGLDAFYRKGRVA